MVGTALIFIITVRCLALVLLAVGFVRKVGTAREGAWFFRFVRHSALQKNALKFYAHFIA